MATNLAITLDKLGYLINRSVEKEGASLLSKIATILIIRFTLYYIRLFNYFALRRIQEGKESYHSLSQEELTDRLERYKRFLLGSDKLLKLPPLLLNIFVGKGNLRWIQEMAEVIEDDTETIEALLDKEIDELEEQLTKVVASLELQP